MTDSQHLLIHPFKVGDKVLYRNHVKDYTIDVMTIEVVGDDHVVANTDGRSRPLAFHKDGVATWSSNLSISLVKN